MTWPTPQEYNEAIQNPSTAFTDPELRAGLPVLTPLGLPRPITGGFASVYQVVCANQRVWAVRCFLRDFGDHQARYAAISDQLLRARLPYMVNFSFLPDGIRVGGRMHPILKMEWVAGDSFLSYVERNLQNPAALLDLAQQWVQMAQTLAGAGIAHGDLQHGNVIVVGGSLRLIDYDGMYVPALAGRQSHEIGHRNYQHPQRTEALFGPGIDNFSTWVVYSSLVALAVEPELWQRLRGGDECLLFRREDFVRPDQSPALTALQTINDARIIRLSAALRTLFALDPDRVPPIDGQLNGAAVRVRPAAAWVRDHLGGSATTSPQATPAQAPQVQAAPPSWIEDFIAPPAPVSLPAVQESYARERAVAGASVAFALATWLLLNFGAFGLVAPALITAVLLGGNLGHLALRYRRRPEVVARRMAAGKLRHVRRAWAASERGLLLAERENAHIQHVYDRQCARIDQAIAREQAAEQQAVTAQNQRHQRRLDRLQVQRHRLQQDETLTVQQLQTAYRQRIEELDRQLAALDQGEAVARHQLLDQRRKQFVDDFLARQRVDKALISGIGPGVKERLKASGIVRVTDVTAARLANVPGIGAARADVLLTWRTRVEDLAWQAAPTKLDRRDEREIHRRHEQLKVSLTKERERLERKLARKVESARERYAARRTALAEEETRQEERHRTRVGELRKHHRERVQQLRNERTTVDKDAAVFFAAVKQEAERVAHTQQRLGWERANLERQLRQLEEIDFPRYVRSALLLPIVK